MPQKGKMRIMYTVVLRPPRLQRSQFWKARPLRYLFDQKYEKNKIKKHVRKQILLRFLGVIKVNDLI